MRVKERVQAIIQKLAETYPDADCELDFKTPFQLLVATILSAQCTDRRVNMVTPALFARYPDAHAYATADPVELERMVQSTGFFRNKARSIIQCCQQMVEQHGMVAASRMRLF